MKEIKNNEGSVLITAVFAMTMLLIIGASLIKVSKTDLLMAHNRFAGYQAYYIAEAGINKALAKLKADPFFQNKLLELAVGQTMSLTEKEEFAGGSFEGNGSNREITLTLMETIPEQSLLFTIEATGKIENAQVQIKSLVQAALSTKQGDLPDGEVYIEALDIVYWK